MSEEKISSVGSSSSSGRSGLSQSELCGIAAKALALSKTKTDKNIKPRQVNTTLQQIASTKRISNYSSQGKSNNQAALVPYSYSSAQRLSERLTRAERFSALKNAKLSSRVGGQQSFHHHNESNSPGMSDTYNHPVFGYPKHSIVVDTILPSEEKPVLSPEPSCVRRSKHLSKALQNKANQFALASPSRRSKGNITGFLNSHEARHDANVPNQQHSHKPKYTQQDQYRFDPLGLDANRPLPQVYGSFPYDTTSLNVTTDPPQQPYCGAAKKQPKVPLNNIPNLQFQPNTAPKQLLGLNRTVDHTNSHPAKQNQHVSKSSGPSPTKDTLTPGQKLEILAREQRSKFQEDQTRYRNFNEISNNKMASDESDNDTTYLDDGVSSVDGDILHDEAEPISINPITVETRSMSNQVRMNQPPYDYTRQINVRSIHDNMYDSRQGNAFSKGDVQQSYRHISKRPEPIPMAHQYRPPVAACDNTFTGSLNIQYKSTTPATAHDNTFTGSLNPNIFLSVNDSSDSSAAKPDAFRWLHQKYGNQASRVPDVETRYQSQPVTSIAKLPISTKNTGNDDDDDVFFGLDEVIIEDIPRQTCKERSPDRMPSPTMKERANYSESPPDNGKASNAKTKAKKLNVSQLSKVKTSPRNIDCSEVERNFQPESNQDMNLPSEMEQKKRHRPFPVETAMEEARASLSGGPKSLEREETVGDDESEQDENKPPTSVLKNLGSVIVKSIQRACAIPGKLNSIVLFISLHSNILLTS